MPAYDNMTVEYEDEYTIAATPGHALESPSPCEIYILICCCSTISTDTARLIIVDPQDSRVPLQCRSNPSSEV
jgi:hypothetical protein